MECVERIALKHIHYHVKNMISASLMHETGHPKSVLWDNIEGWGGGGGRKVQDQEDTCIRMANSC